MATRVEAAQHLFMDPNTFDALRKRGALPPSRGRAGYRLDECRQRYIEHLKGQTTHTPELAAAERARQATADDLQKERARLAQHSADGKEIENMRQRGELVPHERLTDYCLHVAAQVRPILSTLAANMKRRNPELRAAELHRIEEECAKASDAIAAIEPPA